MTLAQRFAIKACQLMPQHQDLQDIDLTLDSAHAIDEIMFRRSEYLGGMAAVILVLIAGEQAAEAG